VEARKEGIAEAGNMQGTCTGKHRQTLRFATRHLTVSGRNRLYFAITAEGAPLDHQLPSLFQSFLLYCLVSNFIT